MTFDELRDALGKRGVQVTARIDLRNTSSEEIHELKLTFPDGFVLLIDSIWDYGNSYLYTSVP